MITSCLLKIEEDLLKSTSPKEHPSSTIYPTTDSDIKVLSSCFHNGITNYLPLTLAVWMQIYNDKCRKVEVRSTHQSAAVLVAGTLEERARQAIETVPSEDEAKVRRDVHATRA